MPITFKRQRDPKTWDDVQYKVTLFRARGGHYPRATFRLPGALFHADDDMVFMVTHGQRWAANKDLPYSEVDWLDPQVIRLAGAMMMITEFEESSPRFYPEPHHSFIIEGDDLDFGDPLLAQEIRVALQATMENPDFPIWVAEAWRAYPGDEFALFDAASRLELDLLPRYWATIDVDDHVLMRGIHALIKSDMLASRYEFEEEACIQTFIAMEASHQLVLEHLRAEGNPNPSSVDAGDWVNKIFDEPLGVGFQGAKYFEEFYEQRIQTVHPRSRFGDTPFAPIAADDRMHLRGSLPHIFGYLVLGEHNPSFFAALGERTRARPNRCTDGGGEAHED
jgi:hypothetical protein